MHSETGALQADVGAFLLKDSALSSCSPLSASSTPRSRCWTPGLLAGLIERFVEIQPRAAVALYTSLAVLTARERKFST